MGPLLIASLAGLALTAGSALFFFRWGWKGLFASLPLLGALFFYPGSGSDFFPLLVTPVFMGAMAGITFRSGRSVQFFIVASTLSLTLVFTANYFFLKYGRQYDMLKKSRENVVAMVKASEATESEREILLGKVEESFRIVKDIIPFSYFLNSLIFSAFGFWVMRAFFERFSGAAFRGGGIEFFQLKDYFVFALIAGWLVVLLVDKNGYGPLHAAGLNLALIMTVLYLIQSLGIIKHFMLKKGWPTYLVPAVLVLFLLLGVEFFMFFLIILSGVGIIDFWADFRKLGVRTGKEE